jgi:pSer/pThr/pTyr-binding forkhead associated (FHA) protein
MATLRLIPASGPPIEVTRDSMVGREPTCEIVVTDGSVSRKHARIEPRGAAWFVVDQGSANGTFLDSQRVAETVVRHGQELRFGAVGFKVEIPGEEDLGATVANIPALGDGATVIHSSPLAATPAIGTPRAPGPPPVPKSPASPPPPPPARPASPPAPSAPPAPPSAAAAKQRFRSATPTTGAGGPVPQITGTEATGATPKKGRSPLFWIASGCCGCLLLVLIGVGLLGGSVFYMTKGANDAVQAEVLLIKQGQVDKAYEGLSQSLRAEMSLQDFEQLISQHPGLKDNADATFWNRSVKNDTGTFSGVLTPTPSAGPPEPVTFELVKEGGVWKISAIRFQME